MRVVPHGAPTLLARPRRGTARRRRGRDKRLRGALRPLDLRAASRPARASRPSIAALPAIVERHPEVLYVIAGRTHPGRRAARGRALPPVARSSSSLDLGLAEHVEFDDRFLTVDEIADLLATTDRLRDAVPATPSRSSSGALTFAHRRRLRCRLDALPLRARTCSRPGAGELVPFADPAALERRRLPLHRRARTRCAAARAEARRIGATLSWPSVAARDRVGAARGDRARAAARGDRQPSSRSSASFRHRPPADAGRRRRDRPARARRHPEPPERLLRRRRRPARGRRARARAPLRRAVLDVDRLPLARVPARRDRRPGRACATS